MQKPVFSKSVLEFFRQTGSRGGKSRATKYTTEQLSAWGRKGGRPRKNVVVATEAKERTK
jgi:hypothetical protein